MKSLKIGDNVKHKHFGSGVIFEISFMLGFADINLHKEYIYENGKKIPWDSDDLKKIRSKTFEGIADAMANQWGKLI